VSVYAFEVIRLACACTVASTSSPATFAPRTENSAENPTELLVVIV
jgi:hypothetical protein